MGFNHDVRLWYIGGTPWENPEAYRRQSAYTHIAKVTTPTLILHGEQDDTDTIGQSMMFYQGLKDRGVLRPGACADVAMFDPQAIADRATYDDPHRYAAGVSTVVVNGAVVIDGGDHTGALPGRVLRFRQ